MSGLRALNLSGFKIRYSSRFGVPDETDKMATGDKTNVL